MPPAPPRAMLVCPRCQGQFSPGTPHPSGSGAVSGDVESPTWS